MNCYISVDASTNIDVLSSILRDQGIIVNDKYLNFNSSIESSVIELIGKADFVISVLKNANPNIYTEMGICIALGKPILIIKDNESYLPDLYKSHICITTNLNDKEFLEKIIMKFVEKQSNNDRTSDINGEELYNKSNLNVLLDEYRDKKNAFKGKDLEDFVEKVFKVFKVDYVRNSWSELSEGEIDFILYPNKKYENKIGTVVVEIKLFKPTHQNVNKIYEQVINNMATVKADFGLILYSCVNDKKIEENYINSPNVILVNIEDLILEGINKNETIFRLIINKRNQVVHGRRQNE